MKDAILSVMIGRLISASIGLVQRTLRSFAPQAFCSRSHPCSSSFCKLERRVVEVEKELRVETGDWLRVATGDKARQGDLSKEQK